jgi:hypothetical protein
MCPRRCCKRCLRLHCQWYRCSCWSCRCLIVSIVDWYILLRKMRKLCPLWCRKRRGARWSVVGARSSEEGRVGASWSVVGAGWSDVGASCSEVRRFGVLLLLDGCSLLLLERCFLLLLGVCSLLLQEGRSLVAWYILLRRMRRLCPLWCCKRRMWLPCHWYKCLRWVCRRSIVSIVDWYILRRKFEIVSPLVLCAVYLATLLFVPD